MPGATFLVPALIWSAAASQAPPPLPTGLGEPPPQEPSDAPPELPPGLGAPAHAQDDPPPAETKNRIDGLAEALSGFVEGRAGFRTQSDPDQKAASIGEVRLQLETEKRLGPAIFNVASDFVFEPVEDDHAVDLETGRGAIDLRAANVVLRPFGRVDLKIGRQVLTWGTGDLVFVNDLFPKDFRAFFIGRDDEYLKAPSDAVRTSIFTDLVNVDIVYTPRFDADRFVDGSRLSYYDPRSGAIVGRRVIIEADRPDRWFEDDEIALRLSRFAGPIELRLYGYHGFWKTPTGLTAEGVFVFPRLAVYGGSARGPLLGGVGHTEFGFYDSRDDRDGDDPFTPNSQLRVLIGFEREAARNVTLAVQYYLERNSDFGADEAAASPNPLAPSRSRHVLTMRATRLALQQNLTLSLFNFWSPNQDDGYLRARAGFKLTDAWLLEGGANIFYGRSARFFGQFQDNSNVYFAARRSF